MAEKRPEAGAVCRGFLNLAALVTVVVEGNAGRYNWVRIWDNRFTKSFKMAGGRRVLIESGTPDFRSTAESAVAGDLCHDVGPRTPGGRYVYRRAIMYGPTRNQAPFSTHIS